MIQLPEIDDDNDQFYCIRISSETLGDSIEFKNYELLKSINKTEIDRQYWKVKSGNLEKHYKIWWKEPISFDLDSITEEVIICWKALLKNWTFW
jgi:hypothetical protein